MKPSARNKVVLVAMVAAVVGGVYLLRASPSTSITSEDHALPVAQAEWQAGPPEPAPPVARAVDPGPAVMQVPGTAGGDAAYKREVECVKAMRLGEILGGLEKVCKDAERFKSNPAHQGFFDACAKREAKYANQRKAAEKTQLACPTAAEADAELAFFQATVAAAKAGNTEARMCYLNSRFNLGREWSDEERAQYTQDAPRYVDEAIASGDWRIAETYRMAGERVVNRSTLLHLVAPYDAVYQYKMNRLMRLGTIDPQFAKALDNSAESPHSPLDPQAKADANLWAQETYRQYFRNSPKLTKAPTVCGEYPILIN